MADELADPMVESIGDPSIQDIAIDAAELGIDALLEDGPIKDIPIIGTIARVIGAGANVRDMLFARKLLRFLKGLDQVSERERRKFREKAEGNPEFRQRLGEHLVLLLERLDDMMKPDLVARVFREYLTGSLPYEDFLALSLAVDRCLLSDLAFIQEAVTEYHPAVGTRLSACGLIEQHSVAPAVEGPGGPGNYRYRPTDLGIKLSRIRSIPTTTKTDC